MNAASEVRGVMRVAADLFDEASVRLQRSFDTYQDIVETQEVVSRSRTTLGQQVRVDDLDAAYARMFTDAAAGAELVRTGVDAGRASLPSAIADDISTHLDELETHLDEMERHRTGAVGFGYTQNQNINALSALRGDAESASILLRALDAAGLG